MSHSRIEAHAKPCTGLGKLFKEVARNRYPVHPVANEFNIGNRSGSMCSTDDAPAMLFVLVVSFLFFEIVLKNFFFLSRQS